MPARLNCTGASQALHEANDGGKAYPQCGIRLAACNSVKRVPVMSLLARKPGQTTMAGTTGEKDMKVWGPINNKRATRPSGAQCTCLPQGQKQLLRLESQGTKTFSYLPELTDALIASQVQMVTTNGLSPCLGFATEESSLVSNNNTVCGSLARPLVFVTTMWKLPKVACTDASDGRMH